MGKSWRACVLGLLPLAGWAPVLARAADSTAWFQQTTQRLYDAVAAGDRQVWDAVLDDECVISDEDGKVWDRAQFLTTLNPLPHGMVGHINVQRLTVRELGQAAVVHYWLDETEEIFSQHLHTVYVETDTYRRVGAGWKALAMHVSVVPRDMEAVDVDRSGWPTLVGTYGYDPQATSRYRVFLRDGELYAGRDEKSATRLIPLAPLVFHQAGSIHLIIFVRDRQGAVNEAREVHKYNEIRMQRMAQ
jgi:Domain of unknown function (DUF4440)